MVSVVGKAFISSSESINLADYVAYFQPICDPHNSELRGFEALIRQRIPGSNMVFTPEAFLPGMTDQQKQKLDLFMTEEACKFLSEIRVACGRKKAEALFIGVNLEPQTLAIPDLNNRIGAILARYGISPKNIEFEIVEKAFPHSSVTQITENIRDLCICGHPVVLDDLTSGSSDLARLNLLKTHLSGVKIDREFLKFAPDAQREIIGQVGPDMHITFEGVETQDDMKVLALASSGMVQGYGFFRPLPKEEALATMGFSLTNNAEAHVQPNPSPVGAPERAA